MVFAVFSSVIFLCSDPNLNIVNPFIVFPHFGISGSVALFGVIDTTKPLIAEIPGLRHFADRSIGALETSCICKPVILRLVSIIAGSVYTKSKLITT